MKFLKAQEQHAASMESNSNLNITIEMRNLTLQGFGYLEDTGGGAVYVSGVKQVLFDHVHFTANTGRTGGAVFLRDTAAVVFRACSFSGWFRVILAVNGYLTTYWLVASTCLSCRVLSADNAAFEGGAVYLEENAHNVVIVDGEVSRCLAYSNGGFLHAGVTNNHITVNSSHFFMNEASNQGGAFYLHDLNNDFAVTSSQFIENRAYHGAGIHLNTNNADLVVSDCDFIENR